ncbi:MAG: NTP transferase domain-containing protein [Ignavibacteriales bacterium]|nr:NTP transferase domain-containing protein [Ignavibacteriales bacterium]
MNKPRINGLLIAAGFSRRMGDFKPLMEYDDNPYIVVITKKLLSVCEIVVIVTGHKSVEIESTIKLAFIENILFPRVKIVVNPNFERGMFTSLQAGLKELIDSEWILYHFVDQPFHKEKFYKEFVAQIDDEYDWIQPVYDSKDGHPVMFKKTIFEKIISSPEDHILRLIRDDDVTKKKKWECNYPQILKDFDTPEDVIDSTK